MSVKEGSLTWVEPIHMKRTKDKLHTAEKDVPQGTLRLLPQGNIGSCSQHVLLRKYPAQLEKTENELLILALEAYYL